MVFLIVVQSPEEIKVNFTGRNKLVNHWDNLMMKNKEGAETTYANLHYLVWTFHCLEHFHKTAFCCTG